MVQRLAHKTLTLATWVRIPVLPRECSFLLLPCWFLSFSQPGISWMRGETVEMLLERMTAVAC